MKHIQTLMFAAICGLVMALTAAASAETIEPGVATVVRVIGEARYSLGDGAWHPLVPGKILAAGAVIQSGPDARVDIVLGKQVIMPQANPVPDRIGLAPDSDVRGMVSHKPSVEQNVVRMMGDTVLAIDKLTVSDTGVDTVSDTELDLRQGGMYNSVKKLSGASQYLIKIPNGIAGVRGTLFYIGANGECSVYKSSVILSIIGGDGKPATVVVDEGTHFDPQTGQTSPLPPSVISELNITFKALRTLYRAIIIFDLDRTQCHISPTTGNQG